MGFLILDTDKQSTHSLRLQLAEISDRPIWEVADAQALVLFKTRKTPAPEIVFFDQDGDPDRVEAFRQELLLGKVNSIAVVIGSDSKASFSRHFDSYLRKPIFPRRLEKAIAESFSRGQYRRSVAGYIGSSVPSGLVRELSRSPELWKQLSKIEAKTEELLGTSQTPSRLGVVFVVPEGLTSADVALVQNLFKNTNSSRVTIVGVGKNPKDTFLIRTLADYFVDPEGDWKEALRNLALFRCNRYHSDLLLSRARHYLEGGKYFLSALVLRRIISGDPWNIKALTLLADIAFAKKRFTQAANAYRKILKLNPCLPRPYFKLLEIEHKVRGRRSEPLLARANEYCPKLKQLKLMGLD